ncbi:unnamed protein product [Arctogadus glacialis]
MSSINCLSHNDSDPAQKSPAGLSTALASVLILTIVVDIVGNVLVILSVFRNKKLRNAVPKKLYTCLRLVLKQW